MSSVAARMLLSAAALVMAAPVPEAAAATGTKTERSNAPRRAERRLGEVRRPTVPERSAGEGRRERAGRMRLQIPERLRAALERKIEHRITRNVGAAKRLRREAMGLLEKLLQEMPEGAEELPEALMRLGELEWEEAREAFLAAFKRWERKPTAERGAPPAPDYAQPRRRFQRVLRDHKTFRRYDLALYVDGFLASEVGQHQEALDRFEKILAWFPESVFVPDAHMVRAEYEFTKDFPDYKAAFEEYEKVLHHEGSDLYDIALFKSAWCLWRLGSTDEAARRFLTVFRATAEAAPGRRRAELDELQAEALRNLVAVFVEDEKNTAEDMHRFLVKAGGEQFAGKIVRALATAFYDQAHYERGIEAYRLLLKLEPTAPDAYEHGLSVASGYSTMEAWGKLDATYRELIAGFTAPPEAGAGGAGASAWVRVQNASTLAAAEAAIEEQLRQDAVSLHAKAQADRVSRTQFEAAVALYDTYLSRFSARPEAYEIQFNRGEIYFYRLRDDAKAADAYLSAVRLQPEGELSRDALVNALAALEGAREKELEAARKAGKKAAETPTDKKLTDAMELYVSVYPDDENVPELLFRQGKLYYDYEVYDPAVRQFGLLVEKYPRSAFSVDAGELILDSFNKSEDYENIEVWARRLKKAPAFQQAEQQKRLDTLIVQAVFKQGEQLGAAGAHDRAAAAYLRAAREFPREPRAAQAAVNAEVEARKAGDFETLKAAVSLLLQDHRERKEAAQGAWIAASAYQSVGLFAEAADYHEVLADGFRRHEKHKDAAYNAVLLRTVIGDHEGAIRNGQTFTKHYPRGEETDEVTFLMGKAHEKAEKWKEAEALYARYAKTARRSSSRIEAYVRLATVRVRLGDEAGAGRALAEAMKTYKVYARNLDDKGKHFAAKARYMQGERILAEFDSIQIEGDVAQLKTRLKKKSALLKRAADAFLETAAMGVAEHTTAALYQIGFIYESFSKALLESPPPPSLTPEEQDQYAMQIDEFVIPIEERSLEAYESGWLKAIELGIFNEWTAKMREALGRLNTELYPPLREIGFALRARAPMALPPLIDGPRRDAEGRAAEYRMAEPEAPRDGAAGRAGKGSP